MPRSHDTHTPDRRQLLWQVLVSDGRQFVGSTPTSPFAQLALAQRTLEVVNGVQVRNKAYSRKDWAGSTAHAGDLRLC